MQDQKKKVFVLSIWAVLVVIGIYLIGCSRGLNVNIGDKRYTMIEPKKQKDLTKSSEGTKEVDQASKKEESKTVEGLKNADKVKSDLIGGIEKAITTMENWDKLTPEERLSVINTLKNLASENK